MTFKLDTHKIVHERSLYTFIDWLGDVGGVAALLKFIFIMFFGHYMDFSYKIESTINSSVEDTQQLSTTSASNNPLDGSLHEGGNIQ